MTIVDKKIRPAVFFDRDGTLNEMVYDETHGIMDSPRLPDQVRLMPGASEAILRLRTLGFLIVVVTNQPGIAKGTLTEQSLRAVNDRLAKLLHQQHAAWDFLYYCPHHPNAGTDNPFSCTCDCRKPRAGLFFKAAREHGISLRDSWTIGDGIVDIQAGHAAGCRTVLVTKLKLEQIERFIHLNCEPDYCAGDLSQATGWIESSLI